MINDKLNNKTPACTSNFPPARHPPPKGQVPDRVELWNPRAGQAIMKTGPEESEVQAGFERVDVKSEDQPRHHKTSSNTLITEQWTLFTLFTPPLDLEKFWDLEKILDLGQGVRLKRGQGVKVTRVQGVKGKGFWLKETLVQRGGSLLALGSTCQPQTTKRCLP